MKSHVVIEVGAAERYVIARYFSNAKKDQPRPRATRAQVRRFAQAAVLKAVRDYTDSLRGRAQATAKRLASGGTTPDVEPLVPPVEQQPDLVGL